jgi:cob(I)alamin adenosyltransferase
MSKRVYTKTGDKGYTSLLGGTKVPKNNLRIEAYGTIDELNSFIGLLSDHLGSDKSKFMEQEFQLNIIQNNLFKIGSVVSKDPNSKLGFELSSVDSEDVNSLENWIDKMDDNLPELKNFILPGGHIYVSTAHVARTVCRRAERLCVLESVPSDILIYLNRLSDYLFVLSRHISYLLGVEEKIWKSN